MAHPGECRHFGHATKLHSFKSHNSHEDPGFGGPIPVTLGSFETTVTTLTRSSGVYHGGDAMGGGYRRENWEDTVVFAAFQILCGDWVEALALKPPKSGKLNPRDVPRLRPLF